MLRTLKSILDMVSFRIHSMNSKLFVAYLRKSGVIVGEGTSFSGKQSIDLTRPCLVEIGKNCTFTEGVTLLTHGYDWSVLREKYGEVLGSSGKVVIEDEVFIGTKTLILKGVRIGRDSIIGAGSVVTHDIPSNSVAAGNPCKVIMTIDEYYEKRKNKHVEEAKAYALELYRKKRKIPRREDFPEEFPLFLDREEELTSLFKSQLGSSIARFRESKPTYASFEEFLIAAGIPAKEIKTRGNGSRFTDSSR